MVLRRTFCSWSSERCRLSMIEWETSLNPYGFASSNTIEPKKRLTKVCISQNVSWREQYAQKNSLFLIVCLIPCPFIIFSNSVACDYNLNSFKGWEHFLIPGKEATQTLFEIIKDICSRIGVNISFSLTWKS